MRDRQHARGVRALAIRGGKERLSSVAGESKGSKANRAPEETAKGGSESVDGGRTACRFYPRISIVLVYRGGAFLAMRQRLGMCSRLGGRMGLRPCLPGKYACHRVARIEELHLLRAVCRFLHLVVPGILRRVPLHFALHQRVNFRGVWASFTAFKTADRAMISIHTRAVYRYISIVYSWVVRRILYCLRP